MLSLLLHWIVYALVLLLISQILPGVYVADFITALMAALMLGIVNALILPILGFLTLPINILTLGLFSFVLNALMFALAAAIVPGFEVSNFISALCGSLLLAIFSAVIFNLTGSRPLISK